MTIKLTTNELKALRAIDVSEYGDALKDGVWSFTIAQNSDLNKRSVPGVVASLQRKGLVTCTSEDGQPYVSITDLGVVIYIKELAKTGEKPKKHFDEEVVQALMAAEEVFNTPKSDIVKLAAEGQGKEVIELGTVTINLEVSTDRLGSKVYRQIKVDAKEWAEMNDLERRDMMIEIMFEKGMINWDYTEVKS